MYARFTDRARKVMQLAHAEAQRFNHEYIGTEHILLGLIAEGTGVATNVLRILKVDSGRIREEIEKIVQPWPRAAGADQAGGVLSRFFGWLGFFPSSPLGIRIFPQTPHAKKVLEFAIEEARTLDHNYVGTEHLLLGLIREDPCVAAQILLNLGLNLEQVRGEVKNLLGQRPQP